MQYSDDDFGVSRRRFMAVASLFALSAAGPTAGAPPVQAPRAARGIIDLHAHVFMEEFGRLFGTTVWQPPRSARPQAPTRSLGDNDKDLAERIALMDSAGVAVQVLSAGSAPYFAEEDKSVATARFLNDRYAQICTSHPGRFATLLSLPLPYMAASLAELRRGFDLPAVVGVAAPCSSMGISIADDRFAPLYEELDARGAALVIHPAANGFNAPLLTEWRLSGAGVIFEDTAAAIQMIQKAIPIRYPNIKIVLPHLGGSLPMMLRRLDNQLSSPDGPLREKPSLMARRFWYDTVSHGSPAALRVAVEAFGHDRLVPGSDFPVLLSFESYADTFDYIRRARLGADQAADILYRNARHVVTV